MTTFNCLFSLCLLVYLKGVNIRTAHFSSSWNNLYVSIYMLIIACNGMGLVLADCSHNGPRPKDEGHYSCLKANTKAIPIQATINLFIKAII